MKVIYIMAISLLALMGSGCYSVEQSMVERGYRWIKRGDFDRANNTFSMTIKQYPSSYLAYTGRGDALYELGRVVEAIADYGRAISCLPDERQTVMVHGQREGEIIGEHFMSYQNQGLVFRRGFEAYIYFRRGICYDQLAFTKYEMNSVFRTKALNDFEQALTLSPHYIEAQNARDNLLQRRVLEQIKSP